MYNNLQIGILTKQDKSPLTEAENKEESRNPFTRLPGLVLINVM